MKQTKYKDTNFRKQCSIFLLIAFSFFGACQNDPKAEKKEEQTPVLPNTVQEVASQWLQDYNSNHFAKAKKLSTTQTIEMIDTISLMIAALGGEQVAFTISNLQCASEGDSARCNYLYQEPDFEVPDSLLLVRQNGQWLVDMPLVEGDGLMEGDLEKLFDNPEEVLEKLLQQ